MYFEKSAKWHRSPLILLTSICHNVSVKKKKTLNIKGNQGVFLHEFKEQKTEILSHDQKEPFPN